MRSSAPLTRTRTARTSTATTRTSEPEVVAGIASAEGQPATYEYTAGGGSSFDTRLALVGAAGVLGIAAGVGLARRRR